MTKFRAGREARVLVLGRRRHAVFVGDDEVLNDREESVYGVLVSFGELLVSDPLRVDGVHQHGQHVLMALIGSLSVSQEMVDLPQVAHEGHAMKGWHPDWNDLLLENLMGVFVETHSLAKACSCVRSFSFIY